MTDLTVWLGRGSAGSEGPYAYEDLRRLIAEGAIGPHTRTWSREDQQWVPLRQRLPDLCRRPLVRRASWTALGVQVVLYLASAASCIILLVNEVGSFLPHGTEIWAWSLSGLALAAVSISGARSAFLIGRALGRRRELGAILQVASGLALIAGLGLAFLQVSAAAVAIPSRNEMEAHVYSIGLDDRTGNIIIVGDIGPGFANKLRQVLDSPNRPRTIEINSRGGLVTEAMAAARLIEGRGAVAVIARHKCASACLIVLMSAPVRLADWDMELAFHATSLVVEPRDRRLAWLSQQIIGKSDEYLRRRGVPQDILEMTNKAGVSRVYAVPAGLALRRGLLTGLVVGDNRLSTEQAYAAARVRRASVKTFVDLEPHAP